MANAKSLRAVLLAKINRRLINRHLKVARARSSDLFAEIEKALASFHRGGGYQRSRQDLKVYCLLRILEELEPVRTLELGSGISTVAFGLYARSRPDLNHVVVDQSKVWLDNTRRVLNSRDLGTERFLWLQHDRKVQALSGRFSVSFDHRFEEDFDLVFVDGPGLVVDGQRNFANFNSDIFKIADFSAPRHVVVDIRKSTVLEMEKRLGSSYSVVRSDLLDPSRRIVLSRFRYFSVFTLIQNHR